MMKIITAIYFSLLLSVSLGWEQPWFGFENPKPQNLYSQIQPTDSTKSKQVKNISMISWSIPKANPAATFVVERGIGASGIFKMIGKVVPTERKPDATRFMFMDIDAIPGGAYSYRIIEKTGIQTTAQYTPTVMSHTIEK